jgi:AraC-like DNA-binding protein
MDPLSDVIRGIRLNGAHFYRVEAAPPWCASAANSRELVPRVLVDSEHLISFHILLSGSCWGGLEGEQQVQMQAGDVIMFPHGDPHVMSSHEAQEVRDVDVRVVDSRRFSETVYLGDSGHNTTFVCGFLGCDLRPFNPLLAALPRRLHARGVATGWLATLSDQVVSESRAGRVGKDTMVTRMAELLFIEAVRQHLERPSTEQTGWLAGLVDPVVGPALTLLHERPESPWTLPQLARICATSRTVLAERFTRALGVSPMQYLKRWRLQLASDALARGSAKVAAIAERVGYESEAAFSRAFKQQTGVSPAAWRRRRHVTA